jgi:hypothetical protein
LQKEFFSAKLFDMTETKPKKKGGAMPGAGRPRGTSKTEASDLVARVRAASGPPPLTQEKFAHTVGCGTSTIRHYELNSLIPKEGEVREAILKLAKKYGVAP